MINPHEIILKFDEDPSFMEALIDMRSVLSKFINNKKITLYSLITLGYISHHYMYHAIVKMNETIDHDFTEDSESPLLDTCAEFMTIYEMLEDPLEIDILKEMTSKKKLSATRVTIYLDENKGMKSCITDIRSLLTKIKKENKASLHDICILNQACSYLFGNGVIRLLKVLKGSFDEKKEQNPILEMIKEYSMMCVYLMNIGEILNEAESASLSDDTLKIKG